MYGAHQDGMNNITRRSSSSSCPDSKAELPPTPSGEKQESGPSISTSDMSTITVYYIASDNTYQRTDGSGLGPEVQLYYWDDERSQGYAYPNNQIPGYTRATDGRFHPDTITAISASGYAQPSRSTNNWGGSGHTLSGSSNAAQLFQMDSMNPNLATTGAGRVANMNYPTGQISNGVCIRLTPGYVAFAQAQGTDPMHTKFINALVRLQGGY